MTDLDRLAFRLERTIASRFPELRKTGFRLMDLEESLLPFRDARREMANGELASWETTILRLIAGERGYLRADEQLARHARLAVASSSPRLSLVKQFSASTLVLGANTRPQKGSEPHLLHPIGGPCCRHCNGRLPGDRSVSFCPHCGLDINIRQCPACSARLEVGWRYCTTCGRGIDLAERTLKTG